MSIIPIVIGMLGERLERRLDKLEEEIKELKKI
jgi:hypothetical protein